MTSQPPADNPPVDPQPLKFGLIQDDGIEATFEAPVPGPRAPGAPAITVAVTVDPSVPRDSRAELSGLLGRMRAAFEVLPELPPDWDVSGDGDGDGDSDGEEPLDLKQDLRIELRLVWPERAVPVAVIVTVETTAGIVPAPPKPEVPVDAQGLLQVTQKLDDHWHATYSPPPTARVHVTGGQGTMRRRPKSNPTDLHIPPPKSFPLSKAKQFILHAVGGAMDYTLNSGFYSPQHPNNG